MYDQHFSKPNTPETRTFSTGIVYKKSTGSYTVYSNGQFIQCAISSKLRKAMTLDRKGRVRQVRAIEQDPLAVGDEVRYMDEPSGSLIVEILPRRNRLSRQTAVPMPDALPFEQVIVANVDQVVPVFAAAQPEPKWNLLDRYLVSAESAGIPALICITKLDLSFSGGGKPGTELADTVAEYRRIGYTVILTSTASGEGLDEIRAALTGKTSVLLGKSGVGKTSLLNAVQPGLGQRVGAISQMTGKGKHTTSYQEMFLLESGGAVVDTPGVREFGLWDVSEKDLALYFPEMANLVGHCKFGLGCSHIEEPGCAIRKAVSIGQISPQRYFSYQRLFEDA